MWIVFSRVLFKQNPNQPETPESAPPLTSLIAKFTTRQIYEFREVRFISCLIKKLCTGLEKVFYVAKADLGLRTKPLYFGGVVDFHPDPGN